MAGKSTSKSLPQRALGALGKTYFVLVMVHALALGLVWAQGSEPGQNPAGNSTRNPPQNSGQDSGKELPDAPGEGKRKQENGNPVQAVAGMTVGAATAGLKKARDWESGWIAGEYMGRSRPLVSPT